MADKATREFHWRAMSGDVLKAKQERVAAIRAANEVATVDTLEELLFRHDPVGINFGENTDEYRPEAETITLRRDEVGSFEDLRRVVHEEFVRWFDAAIAGPPERYDAVAHEIWKLWCKEPG